MSAATAEAGYAERPLTAEELWRLAPAARGELVKGRFIAMAPVGHPHGTVEATIALELGQFVRRYGQGRVMSGEIGIITGRGPDTVRGADVAYISNRRLAEAKADGYLDVAPELVVEVVSPNDRWTQINEKVLEYLTCGVDEVWVVDPRTRQVACYGAAAVRTYDAEDTLTAPDILPGLSLLVAALFD
jgi:Uma2 family endonuclease